MDSPQMWAINTFLGSLALPQRNLSDHYRRVQNHNAGSTAVTGDNLAHLATCLDIRGKGLEQQTSLYVHIVA